MAAAITIGLNSPGHHLMSPSNLPDFLYQPTLGKVSMLGMLLPCLHDTRLHRHSSGMVTTARAISLVVSLGTLPSSTVIYAPRHSNLFRPLMPVLYAQSSLHFIPTLQSITPLLVPLCIRLLIRTPLTM